jgi:phenylalanyl-tRNA synthetase alpha chain
MLSLSAPERRLVEELQRFPDTPVEESELVGRVGLPVEAVRGSLQRLKAKHLAVVDERSLTHRRLTRRGEEAVEHGLPEHRLLDALTTSPARTLTPTEVEAAGITGEERSAAIGILRRRGLLEEGIPFCAKAGGERSASFPEEAALRALAGGSDEVDEALVKSLTKRGLVVLEHRSEKRWSLSEEGARLIVPKDDRPMLGALTPGLLGSGTWESAVFRPYDVRAAAPYLTGARPHPYLSWVREFEEVLIGLGFVQSEGPLLETEFWNADVLYMPQEHPARSIHDVLSVRGAVGRPPPEGLLERVAAVHEGRPVPGETEPLGTGWRYPYDRAVAARPVLRSQTTSVSARFLAAHPTPPFRMFCLDRNFRYEAVDATHHVEFGQCEGVLGEAGVTLRHLIGVFRTLSEAIGIRELKFRPSYFPFTEPSIEGYVRHPRLGWMEVFPGGMLRPEVLRPLGISVPVAAWGIGVTRLAMVGLGVSDIRDLFQDDLARLTGREE